jgi:hypothetical protein
MLEVLNLKSTPISDAGLDNVAKLKGLKEVNLSFTRVTPEGVGKLEQAIPSIKISR